MEIADPPKAAKRFTYEIADDGTKVFVTMQFPTRPAAEAMADWLEDVLCEAGIEAHESEMHEADDD